MMTNALTFVNSILHLYEAFMKFSEVMIYYNYNMSNIARALEMSRQAVAVWHKSNKIPYPKQCELEIITKGNLRASKED